MFAVGHLALGYLLAKVFQRFLKTDVNLPLVFFLSLIPDVDLLIPAILHRGISHSIIVLTLLFIPFFLYFKKSSLPYFVAVAQHALVGDLLTNEGVQVLWPLTSAWFGLGFEMRGSENISVECISFLLAIAVLVWTSDLGRLFKPSKSSLLLAFPASVILLSAVLGKAGGVPVELLLPHLVFLAVFVLAIASFLLGFVRASLVEIKRV